MKSIENIGIMYYTILEVFSTLTTKTVVWKNIIWEVFILKRVVSICITLILILVGGITANAGDFEYENISRYEVVSYGPGVLIVQDRKTGKFGLQEDTFNRAIIFPAEYDDIERFRYGLSEDTYYASGYPCRFTIIRKDGKEGVVRNDGKIIYPLNNQYHVSTIFYNEIALYESNSRECKLVLIDGDGNIIAKQTDIYALSELSYGLRAISRDSKASEWEYVDENWNSAGLGKFDYAGPFSEGLAKVYIKEKGYGFINTKGETVIPFGLYWEGEDRFHKGKVIVRYADDDTQGYGVIDKNNNVIIPFAHSRMRFTAEDGVRIFYGPSSDNINKILTYAEDGRPYIQEENPGEKQWIVYEIKINSSSVFYDYQLYLNYLLSIYIEHYGKPLDATGDFEEDALAAEKIMRKDRVAAGFNSSEEMNAYIKSVQDGTADLTGKPPMDKFEIDDEELYSLFITKRPDVYTGSRGKEYVRRIIIDEYCSYKNINSVADQSDDALSAIMKELADNDILYVFSDAIDCKIFMKNWKAGVKDKPEEEVKDKPETGSNSTYYKNASEWAVPELDKALQHGLITDKIKGNMKSSITREEFCEIAVALYEELTGVAATYGRNHFEDTSNPEISKADELGIVDGVGNGNFAPNDLVTRQEISVMLHRTIKICKKDVDFSTSGVSRFKDEDLISTWAIDAIRFMYKNGIIIGSGDGTMDPQGNTSREQAVLLVVRTFERYMK